MKKKLIALAAAVALCLSMVGCTVSTPASVGTIGGVDIPSGLYLLFQFDAYQKALESADSTQSALSVQKFLKETITVADEATGEETEWLAGDYVAAETLKNIQQYAAAEVKFDELSGELTETEVSAAESYAAQILAGNADLYAANGIGLSSIEAYEQNLYKSSDLLELMYGAEGTEPVSDETLTAHLQKDMVYGWYITVPLYETANYTFATEDQTAEMLAGLQAAADQFNAAAADTAETSTVEQRFYAAVADHIADTYAVLGGEYDVDTSLSEDVSSELFTQANLDSYFNEEARAAISGCEMGEAVAVQFSDYALIVFVRADAAEAYALDDVRSIVLSDLKADDLTALLQESGAALESTVTDGIRGNFPASKIVASVS